jgi:phosphatidylserine/phosphatidylglycerophosphate/cardiolipin synthase-like enzyme
MTRGRIPLLRLLCLVLLAEGGASCAKPVVDVCYTPGGNCSNAIIAEIGGARSEVLVQASALTSKPVMDALVQARESGAYVAVILDHAHPMAENSAFYLSSLRGLPTFIDAQHAVAGNNVVIIDKGTVITGSMVFTADDDAKNAENVVVIRSVDVAGSYGANWNAHKGHSEEFVKIAEPKHKPEETPAQSKAVKKKPGKAKTKKKKIP